METHNLAKTMFLHFECKCNECFQNNEGKKSIGTRDEIIIAQTIYEKVLSRSFHCFQLEVDALHIL